jgi:hypothetical protein
MDIEKQQLLTNPSRAFGELQTAVDINQGFGGRALQWASCWCARSACARVLRIAGFFQLD